MKIFIRFLSVLLAMQGFAASWLLNAPPVEASEMPDVIINEVMWMGSTASDADEWIELRNLTSSSIDLAGWKLTNAATSGATLEIPSGIIAADGYFLISNYDSNNASSVLDVASDAVTTSVSLSNSCGQIDLTLPDNTVVDSMGCSGSSYFAGVNNAGDREALERNIVYSDGLVGSSWHTSVGFANLDTAVEANLATPRFVNDTTAPDTSSAVVNDGLLEDITWSDNTAEASANWSGFSDIESGLTDDYTVKLLDSIDTVIDSAVVTGESHSFSGLSIAEGEMYHFSVSATNNVGLASPEVLSDGFTIDTTAPLPASNLTIADVPGDNGGSVNLSWDPSSSIDQITYRVDYNQTGDLTVLSQNAGADTNVTIDGLDNYPTSYDFMVVAVDFSLLESTGNPTATGSARDNLAPTINKNLLKISQNQPGTSDKVSAKAGFSSEPATVMIFDRNPSDPLKTVLASVATNSSLGFDKVSIGDNLYNKVWVQLVDSAGNASQAVSITNDIVGPSAPLITSATANCLTDRCNVEINWSADNSDTDHFIVRYRSGVNVKESLPVSKNNLTINLAANGSFQRFSVIGFDQYGNPSAESNVFSASLVPGVVTSARLVNGKLVISTHSVNGSKETTIEKSNTPTVKIVPPAKATDNTGDEADVKVSGDQDWLRITVVVILLLIVAGGFYSLSRSIQKSELDIPDKSKKAAATKKTSSKTVKKTKSRRRKKR